VAAHPAVRDAIDALRSWAALAPPASAAADFFDSRAPEILLTALLSAPAEVLAADSGVRGGLGRLLQVHFNSNLKLKFKFHHFITLCTFHYSLTHSLAHSHTYSTAH
jgi:hypothetical protein